MGIEELIEKYTARKERAEKEDESHLYSKGYSRGVIRTCIKIIGDLEQLKQLLLIQQEKVVVPEFVAKWYEALIKKGWSHVKIVRKSLHELEMEYVCYTSDVDEWLDNEDNQELLISMKDGYTVEKEPLYYVKVGNLVFVDWEDSFVAKLATTDSLEWTNYAHKIPTKDGADNIARIVGGEAVPVEEEE